MAMEGAVGGEVGWGWIVFGGVWVLEFIKGWMRTVYR
jgi:hypothetical protein